MHIFYKVMQYSGKLRFWNCQHSTRLFDNKQESYVGSANKRLGLAAWNYLYDIMIFYSKMTANHYHLWYHRWYWHYWYCRYYHYCHSYSSGLIIIIDITTTTTIIIMIIITIGSSSSSSSSSHCYNIHKDVVLPLYEIPLYSHTFIMGTPMSNGKDYQINSILILNQGNTHKSNNYLH